MRSHCNASLYSLALILLFSTSALGGTQQGTPKDPAAVALLNSMYAACGWNSTLPVSVVANGTVTYPSGQSEPVVVEAIPGALRLQTPQFGVVIVVGGVLGINSIGGVTTALTGGVAASIQPWMFPFYSEIASVTDPTLSVTSSGSGSVSATSVQFVSLKSFPALNDGLDQVRQLASQATVAISTGTSLPVQIHFYRMSRETMLSGTYMDAYLSDFRSVNEILVPFGYEERLGNQSLFVIQFQSVVFNTPIPSSDFNIN